MKTWSRPVRAFTLVEIVIALGVLSFSLIVLLGLFGVGMTNGLKSTEDTSLASISWQVVNNLKTQANFKAGTTTNYSFDFTGQLLTNGATTQPYFYCLVTTRNPATNEISDGTLTIATLQITWPGSVKPAPYTNNVYATLAP